MRKYPWKKEHNDCFSPRNIRCRLAELFECEPYEVANAFEGLPSHYIYSKKSLAEIKQAATNLKNAAKAAQDLAKALERTPKETLQLHGLEHRSWIEPSDLHKFAAELLESADGDEQIASRYGNVRRSNPGADIIAEGIARLFEDKGKRVGFSQNDQSEPTGPFSRAVRDAFVLLDVEGSWVEPTKRAVKVRK